MITDGSDLELRLRRQNVGWGGALTALLAPNSVPYKCWGHTSACSPSSQTSLFPGQQKWKALGTGQHQTMWKKVRDPADETGRYPGKQAEGRPFSSFTKRTTGSTVQSPRAAALLPLSGTLPVLQIPRLAWGWGRFRRTPVQPTGPVQLGGTLEARGSTAQRLVRMVEAVVKQGAGGWEVVRI